jgi:hypothetical protein
VHPINNNQYILKQLQCLKFLLPIVIAQNVTSYRLPGPGNWKQVTGNQQKAASWPDETAVFSINKQIC